MEQEELREYLARIGLDGLEPVGLPPMAETLARMQRAHLETVPFENLDIVAGKVPLALGEDALFDKIVRRRRGGFCYELNLLFAAALRALGFDVALKGGRHPKYGDDLDHLFLLVRCDTTSDELSHRVDTASAPLIAAAQCDAAPDEPLHWIADVGFAANFAEPLRLVVGELQSDGVDDYVLEDVGGGYLRLMRMPGRATGAAADAQEMFTFGPKEYRPEDCRERCDWFCTAPESRFTQGSLVSLQLPDGRRTLSGHRFIEMCNGVRSETPIATQEEFDRYLEIFGLERSELGGAVWSGAR